MPKCWANQAVNSALVLMRIVNTKIATYIGQMPNLYVLFVERELVMKPVIIGKKGGHLFTLVVLTARKKLQLSHQLLIV